MKPEDQTFEEWHQDDSRGKKIAFSQGSDDKRLQNQALIAFEHSFHGNYARAMVCIKVHSMARANPNKSVWLVTNTTAASKYIPRRPRISIN